MTGEPVAVPAGERADLQRTAQQTGERFGGIEAEIAGHTRHLSTINGSITKMASEMGAVATSSAVMANTLAAIERTLDTKLLSHESRITVIEAWVAEKRGGADVSHRSKTRSTQWWIAIMAGAITVFAVVFAATVSIAVAIAVALINSGG